jgi:mxaL protein
MSIRGRLADRRLILLILAAVALAPVFVRPSISVSQPVLEYLLVVDITQSMNVRDYTIDGRPVDRLSFAKAALIEAVRRLPCGSLIGLGIFTGWRTAILFDPIELCEHRREIDDVIRSFDWRMTWAPQSSVALGMQDGLATLKARDQDARLVFLTDGDEAPESGQSLSAEHLGSGEPRGILVGVGDLRPSPVPKLDQSGAVVGYFQEGGRTYLSSLKEAYLKRLGRRQGLDYHRLRSGDNLWGVLQSRRYADPRPGDHAISWAFAVAALSLLTLVYIIGGRSPQA